MKTLRFLSFLVLALFTTGVTAIAAGPPAAKPIFVGAPIVTASAYDGYTLYAPKDSTMTYLVDNQGAVINSWQSKYGSGTNAELLSNGHVIRAASVGYNGNKNIHTPFAGGIIEEYDWDGNLVWEYSYNSDRVLQHHFIDVMPNGNVLMLAYEYISGEQALAAGRDPKTLQEGFLTPDHVAEVKKTGPKSGEIVWEWHVFDHLVQDFDKSKPNYAVISEHPERINLNYCPSGPMQFGADWNHAANASYNAITNQVVIAVTNFNEIWVIDHNTTTEEAKGAKGDLVFRYGDPKTYGVDTAPGLDAPHNAEILDDGTITAINFGKNRDKFSSIAFIKPGKSITEAASVEYRYTNKQDMFMGFDLLPNGNALVAAVGGKLMEMTPDGKTVWQHFNPDTGKDMLKEGDEIPMIAAIPGGGPGPKFPANYVLAAQKYAKDFLAVK
jgi:hypothetical protein